MDNIYKLNLIWWFLIVNFSFIYRLKKLIYQQSWLTLVIIIDILMRSLTVSSIKFTTHLSLFILFIIRLLINIIHIKTLNPFSPIFLSASFELQPLFRLVGWLHLLHNRINHLAKTLYPFLTFLNTFNLVFQNLLILSLFFDFFQWFVHKFFEGELVFGQLDQKLKVGVGGGGLLRGGQDFRKGRF